jgi:hypothetical protein
MSRLRFVSHKHDKTQTLPLQLSMSGHLNILRISGGCGYMEPHLQEKLPIITSAIKNVFKGIILAGGTRMINKTSGQILPGITEVGASLTGTKDIITVGVVPREQIIQYDGQIIVSDKPSDSYRTYLNQHFDDLLLLQLDVDKPSSWDYEWQYSRDFMLDYLEMASVYNKPVHTLHVFFDGGGVTKKEIVNIAAHNMPVLLIKGGNRQGSEPANDLSFLAAHPNVMVCDAVQDDIENSVKLVFNK